MNTLHDCVKNRSFFQVKYYWFFFLIQSYLIFLYLIHFFFIKYLERNFLHLLHEISKNLGNN